MARLNSGSGQIARLDARLDVLEAASGDEIILGNPTIGGTTAALTINHTTVIPVSLPSDGVATIEAYIAGDGGGGGSITAKGVVYAGVASSSALITSMAPVTISAGAPADWVLLGQDVPITAGLRYFGFHIGGSNGVATTRYDSAVMGSSYYNNDTYADGTSATFGTATAQTNAFTIRVTFTASLPPYIEGIDAYADGEAADTQVLGIDVGDSLVLTVASGVARIDAAIPPIPAAPTTQLLTGFPMLAGMSYQSGPIEMGGRNISVASAADVAGVSLTVSDSTDGATLRPRAVRVPANVSGTRIADASVPVTRRYVHVAYVNDAGDQGDFELGATIS